MLNELPRVTQRVGGGARIHIQISQFRGIHYSVLSQKNNPETREDINLRQLPIGSKFCVSLVLICLERELFLPLI